MAQKHATFGLATGLAITTGLAVMVTASVMAGDLNIQAAGLDVSLSTQSDRGFVVQIDGADCPGAGCPALALNWSMTKRG
ncbi:MAG: hypothetical protein CMK06_13880 [Ponticaulis sp.]|nr:hypothetical protein [Ponticaulis sp.]|tara:strand:+ start:8269 stop:8508 length:240 start_codon:yes stop_codon:yes gene_type:complete